MKRTVFILCIGISFLLFYPALSFGFFSDDFTALYRAGVLKALVTPGFFRPLGNFTIYLTYSIFGLNPLPFHAFNIFFHGVNTFLVLIFCERWIAVLSQNNKQQTANNKLFPAFAAALFLFYPFHSENIVWSLSRYSLLASFFGLLSLISYLHFQKQNQRIFLVCLFYFIGLACYESIILLPLIIIALSFSTTRKNYFDFKTVSFLMLTLLLHLFIRQVFSGAIIGDYGNRIYSTRILDYLYKIFVTTGRLFIPPNFAEGINTYLAILIIPIFVLISLVILKKEKYPASSYWKLISILCITLITPFYAGISSHTSEGDRLLYFPSVFLSMIIALWILVSIKRPIACYFVLIILVSVEIFFLKSNLKNWSTASASVENILSEIKKNPSENLYLINLPEEHDGAYIFRNGFKEALLLNQIDTSKVTIVNQLKGTGAGWEAIRPSSVNNSVFIKPRTFITQINDSDYILSERGRFSLNIGLQNSKIFYWNRYSLQEFPLVLGK